MRVDIVNRSGTIRIANHIPNHLELIVFQIYWQISQGTNELMRGYHRSMKILDEYYKWICWERPITICAIVKAWLCQRFGNWHKCDVTRRQRPMRALVLFTLQRNMHANMHRTWLSSYSGWPAGFISTCFYSSQIKMHQDVHLPWVVYIMM